MTDSKAPKVYLPPHWDTADVAAFQALKKGEATPEQQKRALNWVLNASGMHDMPYRSGGEDGARDTAFACGRMFMGQQIDKLLRISLVQLLEKENNNGPRKI